MTESLSSASYRFVDPEYVFGYEVTGYPGNPKIGLILKHIWKYGYTVEVIAKTGRWNWFGITCIYNKNVLIDEIKIRRYNAWARKYHRRLAYNTEVLVHELAHVIETETTVPILLHKNYWDSFLTNWFTFDMEHDRRFWSIYHDLCEKYHIRDEDSDPYLDVMEEYLDER